jgi:hypothetical protein
MNEEEFTDWKRKFKAMYYAKIILEHSLAEKKIKKFQYDTLNKKIKKIRYKCFLSSPHLEGREELKNKATLICFKDYCSSVSKAI